MSKKSLLKLIFSITAIVICLCSCSQNLPEVRSGSCNLIFQYDNEDSLPEVKLSVFLLSESEVRRYDSFCVKALSSDYSWTVYDLIKNTENKKSYVGYNNLMMPDNIKFPTGIYNVTLTTYDDETTDLDLNLNYDNYIYSMKGSQVKNYIKNKSYRRKIAAYAEDDCLIFYGQLTGDNSSLEKLKSNYSDAVYYKEIYISSNSAVTFILPKQNFDEGNKE